MVFEKVRDIIVEQLGVKAESITMESSFIEDLQADSLDIVSIVMEIEETFSIEIPDEAAETIVTVGDAVSKIEEAVK